jgi:hypothetical protein
MPKNEQLLLTKLCPYPAHKMVDLRRSFRSGGKQFKYRVNQKTDQKSRMDKIRICENRLHQIGSTNFCLYFADHTVLSSSILPPNGHQSGLQCNRQDKKYLGAYLENTTVKNS